MSNAERLAEEVEALRAIYGPENVSFAGGCVGVRLGERDASVSVALPPGYPSAALPRRPTLSARGVGAGVAAAVVERVVEGVGDAVGEVVLFQYCEGIREALAEIADEEATAMSADVGAAEEDVVEFGYEVFVGEPVVEKKSAFLAHLAYVQCVDDVARFVAMLRGKSRKMASASHHMVAYRIVNERGVLEQDADEDGETGAGKGMLFVLQQCQALNVVCVVSRWFGGTKLGPTRFKIINNVTRDIVQRFLPPSLAGA